jgi:hypothetical protein
MNVDLAGFRFLPMSCPGGGGGYNPHPFPPPPGPNLVSCALAPFLQNIEVCLTELCSQDLNRSECSHQVVQDVKLVLRGQDKLIQEGHTGH